MNENKKISSTDNIFHIFFHSVDNFCLNEDGCVHWTYRANSGKCYLKSSNGDYLYAYSGTVGCSSGNSNICIFKFLKGPCPAVVKLE